MAEDSWRRDWERAVKDSTEHPEVWLGPAISRATVVAADEALRVAKAALVEMTENFDHVAGDHIAEMEARRVAEAERDELRAALDKAKEMYLGTLARAAEIVAQALADNKDGS